jgi:predicted oxidoreductase (fatty acid repression mutant protein)
MKRIKDEDIEKLVDQLVQHLPTAFSKLLGRRVEFVVTGDLKREVVVKVKELFVAIERIELIKKLRCA